MADSAAFESVCSELERATTLDRLETRGTVRLALKKAGLEARSVSPTQMAPVVAKVLPQELSNRGIEDVESICDAIRAGLTSLPEGEAGPGDSPEAVFERLAGGSR